MHPILGDRGKLLVYLLVWQLIGLLLTVGLRQGSAWATSVAFFLPLSYAYAFVCLSTWYLCRAFPLDARATREALNVVLVQLFSACIAGGVWVITGGLWAIALDWGISGLRAQPLYAPQQLLLFVVGALLYCLSSACSYLLMAFEASRAAERRAVEASLLAREAELKALRAQVDPHFLFNSLNSVSALTTVDPSAARTMCLLLADFLRETLRLGAQARITLADELALIDRFLSIERVRFGDRLRITRQIGAGADACLVPPLLIQPLVENAIVHGIGQLVDGGAVDIAAAIDGTVLTIVIENPCDPERRQTRGVGLGQELLRNRVATHFGAEGWARVEERAGTYRVEVRIPAATAASDASR